MTAGRSVVSSPVVQELLDDELADMHSASVHLDAAAINTLSSVPTLIVAAPGTGRGIFVIDGAFESVPGAVGNWSIAHQLGVYWGTADDVLAAATVANVPNMLNGGALPNVGEMSSLLNDPPQIPATSGIENAPLVVGVSVADPKKVGAITALAVSDGSAGYAHGDTGTIDIDQYGGGATYVVNTVGGGGAVTGITLGAAGTGYAEGSILNTTPGGSQPGAGAGLLVTPTSVVQPTGDLYVTVFYRIIDLH